MTDKWTPNDEQRAILTAIKAEAEGNEALFARTFTSYSESMFSKLLAAIDPARPKSYFDEIKTAEARDGLFDELGKLLKNLPALRLEHERVGSLKLRAISSFVSVAKAVRICRNKTNPERLVMVVGPTGSGKTTLRNYLRLTLKGELKLATVESRDAWRPASKELRQRAKLVVLHDLFAALGLHWEDQFSPKDVPELENDLMRFLTINRRVLFIDEAQFFSAYVLVLLKLLLNETRLILVVACTPFGFANWSKHFPDDARQLSRRQDCEVRLDTISAADVGLFFDSKAFSNREKALEFLAASASQFGHFSLIARTSKLLEQYPEAEPAQVESCVEKALRQMGKKRL